MKHYAGLDVSAKETSVCIVDENGKLCRQRKVVSHPEDLVAILSDPAFSLDRVGIEAGPLSQWLFEGLGKKLTSPRFALRRGTPKLSWMPRNRTKATETMPTASLT